MTQTVFVIRGTNRHKAAYHDAPDACQSSKAADQLEEITMEQAELRGLERCKWCADKVQNDTADFSYQKALKQAAKVGGD